MTLHLVSFNTPPGGGEKMYYYCWLGVKVQVLIEVSTDTRDMQVFFHPSKDGNLCPIQILLAWGRVANVSPGCLTVVEWLFSKKFLSY